MPVSKYVLTYIRVGKTESLGPKSRVIVYYSKLSFCQNDTAIGGKLPTIQCTVQCSKINRNPILLLRTFFTFSHLYIMGEI